MRIVVLALALLPLAVGCTLTPDDGDMAFGTGAPGDASAGEDPGPDPDETGGGGTTGDAPGTTGDGPDPGETAGGGTGGAGPDDGGSTGGDDPTGAGGSTGGVGGSTGGDDPTGGSTGGLPGPDQPEEGAWSHCLITTDCNDADLGCLNNGGAMYPTDGVCTTLCAAPQDTTGCPAAPADVSASLGCVVVNTTPVCALMCEVDLDCPGGMKCLEEQSDEGLVTMCM